MNFFNIDGPFQRIGSIVFDVIALGLLWTIISLLGFGVTIGAVTTALYTSVYYNLVKEEGYVYKTFFKALKNKFLKSTLVWLILAALYILMFFNITSITQGILDISWLLPVYFSLTIELLFITLYIFPLMSTTELGIKKLFKYSFILANKHLPSTLLAVIITISLLALLYTINNVLLIIILTPIQCYLLSRVITKKILTQYDTTVW
ncbi:DUF624 domain-containing protein [Vallitalea sp.]|jgi:uncharacterized membrane protein YesL|uniref:DUF624 domain-containing protein n=1 Tax=Vallitalea sp. TaxID=1882829 RepID=UPI0025F11358|nr:DUF624 domain-containing protein [Vallitalea sp.]MCT4688542.1 DUF624 domain-containing protein [Vallitalea sp.]